MAKVLKLNGNPYSRAQLRKDNPRVSFPKQLKDSDLVNFPGVTLEEVVVVPLSDAVLLANAKEKKNAELDTYLGRFLRTSLLAHVPPGDLAGVQGLISVLDSAATVAAVEAVDVNGLP